MSHFGSWSRQNGYDDRFSYEIALITTGKMIWLYIYHLQKQALLNALETLPYMLRNL